MGSKSMLLRTLVAASSAKRRVLALPVLYRSGAPGEIRTPDPQIRSLAQCVDPACLFCKPGAKPADACQWVKGRFANPATVSARPDSAVGPEFPLASSFSKTNRSFLDKCPSGNAAIVPLIIQRKNNCRGDLGHGSRC